MWVCRGCGCIVRFWKNGHPCPECGDYWVRERLTEERVRAEIDGQRALYGSATQEADPAPEERQRDLFEKR